jgi:hypothetical protein
MMKSSDLSKITKKLLHLTKQIYLKEPPDNAGFVSRFFAGQRPFSILENSFGTEWWLTRRGLDCYEDIANMAISFDPQLRGGDRESFGKIIEKYLQENANNAEIFNIDKIYLRQVSNLLEARAVDNIEEFVSRLWSEIHRANIGTVLAEQHIPRLAARGRCQQNESSRIGEISERSQTAACVATCAVQHHH